MTLATGMRFGSYEILGSLGAGGKEPTTLLAAASLLHETGESYKILIHKL